MIRSLSLSLSRSLSLSLSLSLILILVPARSRSRLHRQVRLRVSYLFIYLSKSIDPPSICHRCLIDELGLCSAVRVQVDSVSVSAWKSNPSPVFPPFISTGKTTVSQRRWVTTIIIIIIIILRRFRLSPRSQSALSAFRPGDAQMESLVKT
ncbi:hypothetical protein JOB18_040347 [Solea senegalensis]|uniref:Secreted protein n=1 Tax=Solea senegalensis TaxID=28829 RepID=A0AAV6QMQ4_SOLSE|nr:hypothetical protein JOB18_040347 [Solea senegalensis]